MSCFPRTALTLAIALLLAGCDGDSPGGSSDGLDEGGAGGLNGPLSGTLVIGRRVFDLATGQFSDELVPNVLRGNRSLSASPDGRRLYYIREGCRDRPNRAFMTYDCVVVLDASGTEVDRLDPGLDLSSNAPSVSPDGRYLAVDSTEIFGVQRIVILGPDGTILDEAERTSLPNRMDWGPDGALYYLVDGAVFRATVGEPLANEQRLFRFDEALGFPNALSLSPDGTRFAVEFDAGEGVTEQASSVWLMNADGSELREFATVRAGSRPTVRNPLWSPDGRR